MDYFLYQLIFRKEFNRKIIFTLTFKLIFTQISSRFVNDQIEKGIKKYLADEKVTSLYRKNLLKNLQNNFTLVKRAVYCTILGLSVVVNLEDLVNKCLVILRLLGNLRWPANKEATTKKLPEIKLPEINILLEKNKLNRTTPYSVPVKVPPITISMHEKRTCEIFEKYIFTQKELLKRFEAKKNIGMKERLTTYCTTQVNNSVKKLVQIMRKKSVTAGLEAVEVQSRKVLATIDKLPKNSQKSKDLTQDLFFTLRCIDSYTTIFNKEITLENLDYFKDKILPDLYIIFYAINNEAKK